MNEVQQQKWIRVQEQPLSWMISAQRLKAAADLLFQIGQEANHLDADGVPRDVDLIQFQIERPAMLLLGYAVENAIKAELLQSGRVDWERVKKNKRHEK